MDSFIKLTCLCSCPLSTTLFQTRIGNSAFAHGFQVIIPVSHMKSFVIKYPAYRSKRRRIVHELDYRVFE